MATKETSNMWREIHEQPEAVRNCIEKNRDVMKSIAEQVKQRDIKTVVFAAGVPAITPASWPAMYLRFTAAW